MFEPLFEVLNGYKDSTKHINEINLAIQQAAKQAKLQADYIIISIHSHQISGDAKENPADFLKELMICLAFTPLHSATINTAP